MYCNHSPDTSTGRDLVTGTPPATQFSVCLSESSSAQTYPQTAVRIEESRNTQEIPEWVLQVAHDLSTSLSTVLLSVDILQDNPNALEAQEVWQGVTCALVRQQKLLRSLLTFARYDSGDIQLELEPVELNQVVGDVANEYKRAASTKGLDFGIDITDEPQFVTGTEPFVSTVVANLMDNAVKYSTPGSCVRLSTSAHRRGCNVRISDTGSGIHESELNSLFTPFFRSNAAETHPSRPGFGIGLFLVNKLVRCMNGEIEVESTVGEGTTFTVWLPRWADT